MDMQQIKIFLDVIENKSFVKAAKLNFRTQPTISFQIKSLEEELGSKLLERVPRRVQLTYEGQKLLPYLEEIYLKYTNLHSFIQETKGKISGQVRIATIFSIGVYELMSFTKQFIKKYPHIRLILQYRKADIIYDLVSKNKVDIGLVAYPEVQKNLQVYPFLTDNMVIITHRNHPLSRYRSTSLESLQGQRFIAFDETSPTGKAIKQLFKDKGISVDIRVTNENVDTIKIAVAAGLGTAIVPKRVVAKEIKEGKIKAIEIRKLRLDRPLGILTRKGKILSNTTKLYLQMLNPKLEL